MKILFFLTAYFLGSIPFGLVVSRLVKGIDIREHGSRNIGATNVFRVVGKKWGLLVFILDALKGYVAVKGPEIFGLSLPMPILIGLALTAILGHSFPLWLGFRGGKGVATSLGTFLAAAFLPTLLTFGLWTVVFALSRILSAASLSAAVAYPFVIFLTYRSRPGFEWLLGASLFLILFIFYTHRENIRRLLRGEEKKLI